MSEELNKLAAIISKGIDHQQFYILMEYQVKLYFPDEEFRHENADRFAREHGWRVTFQDGTALFQKH